MSSELNKNLKRLLTNLDAVLACAALTVTTIIVIINVFTRYTMNYIIVWSEEMATTCFVYTVFLGSAWAYRIRAHVGVDLIVDRLPHGVRAIVKLLTEVLMVILNGYITYLSVLFVKSSAIKTMPIMKISSVYVNSALILGFGLMTIYAVCFLIKDIREMLQPENNKEVSKL